jgi:hypothetical protein
MLAVVRHAAAVDGVGELVLVLAGKGVAVAVAARAVAIIKSLVSAIRNLVAVLRLEEMAECVQGVQKSMFGLLF